MKNIHLLKTEKPSRLFKDGEKLKLDIDSYGVNNQNIYITSDEEIKEDDYYLSWENYYNPPKYVIYVKSSGVNGDGKKIILTTDQELIADGVQPINNEFLEWFVKNPSCEFVEVKKQYITPLGDIVDTCYDNERLNYKIIIPQAEPKQDLEKEMFELEQELDIPSSMRWHNSKPKQETLEEVANRLFYTVGNEGISSIDSFIKGAKWQAERMYSIDFIMWYSGMDKDKIENAHKRWIKETFKSE